MEEASHKAGIEQVNRLWRSGGNSAMKSGKPGGVAMKIVRFATLAALAALSACGQTPMDKAETQSKGPNLAFDASVTLTPAAVARLQAAKDHIVIASHYYGFPAKGAESKANQFGQIELGTDIVAASTEAPRARITGQTIDHRLMDSIADGTVYVWTTTRSATPEGFRDELLECSHFRGTVAKAQEAPVALTCDVATAP